MKSSHAVGPSARLKAAFLSLSLSMFLAACGGGGAGTDTVAGNGSGSTGNSTADEIGVGAPGATNDDTVKRLTDVGAANRTFYVATNGSDAASGLDINTPFLTIEKALASVGPGDTIVVREGTYRPTGNGFVLRTAGTAEARIKIKAHEGEKVVLDANGSNTAIYVMSYAPYWIVEGLELSGGGPTGASCGASWGYSIKIDSHHVNLVNSDLHGSICDVVKLVSTSDDVVIYGNKIHDNGAGNAQGVDIVGADRTWIARNHVYRVGSIALYAKGNSRNTVFENNLIENVPSRGIMLGQSTGTEFMQDGRYETYDGVIRNNIIVGSRDACLATASSYNVKIYNNSCYDVTSRHGAIFISNESEYQQAGTNVEVKNNIIMTRPGSGTHMVKLGPNAMTDMGTLQMDNNLYWNGSGEGSMTFFSDNAGGGTFTLANWRGAVGQDRATVVADPKFADVATLTLAEDSPAIDVGVTTDVVKVDYASNSRPRGAGMDIGAYEVR